MSDLDSFIESLLVLKIQSFDFVVETVHLSLVLHTQLGQQIRSYDRKSSVNLHYVLLCVDALLCIIMCYYVFIMWYNTLAVA